MTCRGVWVPVFLMTLETQTIRQSASAKVTLEKEDFCSHTYWVVVTGFPSELQMVPPGY